MIDLTEDTHRLALLHDPIRRALFEYVISRDEDVSRDEAARWLGVKRGVAAGHLDRLVERGLLVAVFRRLTGRSGPGAGRPSKLYRRGSATIEVSLPPRSYQLAGEILIRAIGHLPSIAAHEAVIGEARRAGQLAAQAVDGDLEAQESQRLLAALRGLGFDPASEATGAVGLRNCPFHALAREFPGPVCDMNLSYLEGVAAALHIKELQPRKQPREAACCVIFQRGDPDPTMMGRECRDRTNG